jgi:hypothetical protein
MAATIIVLAGLMVLLKYSMWNHNWHGLGGKWTDFLHYPDAKDIRTTELGYDGLRHGFTIVRQL